MSAFLGGSLGLLPFFSLLIEVLFPWDEKEVSLGRLWESERGRGGEPRRFTGSTPLRAGRLKSSAEALSERSRRSNPAAFRDSSLRDRGPLWALEMLIDLTPRSLVTGGDCPSWQREVGDGLRLGAGTVRVEAAAAAGWD